MLMKCEIGRCLKGNSINCEPGSVSTLNGLGKFIVCPVTESQCDAWTRISPEKPIKWREKLSLGEDDCVGALPPSPTTNECWYRRTGESEWLFRRQPRRNTYEQTTQNL